MARQKGTEHMKPPAQFVQIIERTRYDVTKTTLIASDAYWDGHNSEHEVEYAAAFPDVEVQEA
jgi:hypothetical protein